MNTTNLPTLRIPADIALPDKGQWQFRFEVRSETSDSVYVVAQNKSGKWWGCSCFGWRRYRTCKHLAANNIPGHHTPYEPRIIE
jgi:hypothetical protein